jgi:hypothetical protein
MQRPSFDRWRTFASARYRPFQAIAVGQAFTASFASDALFVPLLLRLGATPALVMVIGTIPVAASVVLAVFPQLLLRLKGDLRILTLTLAVFELRGFVHAATVAAVAAGMIDAGEGIVLVSVTVAIAQTCGVLSAVNISLWTSVVLTDGERRLVGPRMGALTMALSTLLLLPAGLVLDSALQVIGLWAYSCFFVVGGAASILTIIGVRRLPRPGRVLIPWDDQSKAAGLPLPFRRFAGTAVIAAGGSGLLPYASLYAIQVLGASPGFSVFLSGATSAGALIGSLAAGSFLLHGSSSRLYRATLFVRSFATFVVAAAIPGNPAAHLQLLVGITLLAAATNAGILAANERMFRLSPPELRVRCQCHYVAVTSGAVTAGSAVSTTALLLVGPLGWGVYTALYLSSTMARLVAGLRTEVSPTWRSPSAPTDDEIPTA